MSRILPVVLFCLFLFCSCGGDKPRMLEEQVDLPADSLISEPLMIQLMADVHVLEAGIQVERNHGIDPKGRAEQLYEGLFRKYRITRSQFEKNLAWYRSDPDNFAKFYEKVEQELTYRDERFVKPNTPQSLE